MKRQKENPVGLLLSWAGKDKKYLVASVIFAFLSGLFVIGPYMGIYRIMDGILSQRITQQMLIENMVFIAITTVFRMVFMGLSGVLSHKGAYGALFRVRCLITEHLSKVPLGELNDRSTGEIKTVLNEDIEKLELCLAHNIPELVGYLTGPFIIFAYLLSVNVPLALVSLIPLPLAFMVMMNLFKGMMGSMETLNQSLGNFNSVMIEYVRGMRLIKTYNLGTKSFEKFANAIGEENRVWNMLSKKMGPPFAVFSILLESGMVLLVPIGGLLFLKGSIVASVFLMFAYVGSLYLTEMIPLQQLGNTFAQALNGVQKTKEILDIPICDGDKNFPKEHDICLENVGFCYQKENQVLKECNLFVKEGEKIAFVGASGTGKSTLVQLIARFYDPQQGRITIGGVDQKEIRYEEILKNISIVFQKTFLMRSSVYENICMGREATLEEVREAAKRAQIDDFIESLPDKYDTLVGSFSTRFSGGEKQRIAIARAILKDAPILILDEATSAADPLNQLEIDKAISELCKNKTVFIVAHRLGAVKLCDRVAVVENNTITHVGTHEEVLRESDYYKGAWESYQKARAMVYVSGEVAE